MVSDLLYNILKIIKSRIFIVSIIIISLFSVLIYRLFDLQIVNENYYMSTYIQKAEKSIYTPGTRGKILDAKGKVLAYDSLAYAVTIDDKIDSSKEKNDILNKIVEKAIILIEKNKDTVIYDFPIQLNPAGHWEYTFTSDATKNLFNNVGISPLLFGIGANPTYKVIELSLIVDASMMMKLLRQIQRIFNVKYQLEMSIHDYLFEIYFIEQYSFNKDEVANRLQKASMYGLPAKLWYAAALGQEPIDAYTASYLENEVLGCCDKIYNRPLISSNTLSNGEVREIENRGYNHYVS